MITLQGFLACSLSLTLQIFIYTNVCGLEMLGEDKWKLLVLFVIQINSCPRHWKIVSVLSHGYQIDKTCAEGAPVMEGTPQERTRKGLL